MYEMLRDIKSYLKRFQAWKKWRVTLCCKHADPSPCKFATKQWHPFIYEYLIGPLRMQTFSSSQIEAIAAALGHTEIGLTGSEISKLLHECKLEDISAETTKRKRLLDAFAESQNRSGSRKAILAFIRKSMKPERFLRQPDRYEPMRANLNQALLFAGLMLSAAGELLAVAAAQTLSDATQRANELREDLRLRAVHSDVLKFCQPELVTNDYFHAVLEATKSIGSKIREKTGLSEDGAELVDKAFSGDNPLLRLSALATASQRSEQRGFANLLKGAFGMFRNPTAHDARIHWTLGKEDAEDLLSLASLIHRRLDSVRLRH